MNGIEWHLSAWADLIEEVKLDYDDCLAEYENDLWARDNLEQSKASMTREQLSELEALDSQFFLNTREASRSVLGREGPWWRRIPQRITAECAEEFSELL